MISLRPKWSLATQILVVLWVGCVMMVWQRREPWYLERSLGGDRRPAGRQFSHISPDQTRHLVSAWEYGFTIHALDTDDSNLYFIKPEEGVVSNVRFIDNDVLHVDLLSKESQFTSQVFKRRFPEWWWGHFYRPEVWLTIVLSVILLSRLIKFRRSKTKAAHTAAAIS